MNRATQSVLFLFAALITAALLGSGVISIADWLRLLAKRSFWLAQQTRFETLTDRRWRE